MVCVRMHMHVPQAPDQLLGRPERADESWHG